MLLYLYKYRILSILELVLAESIVNFFQLSWLFDIVKYFLPHRCFIILESKNLHVVISDLEEQLHKESQELRETISIR